MAFDRLAQARFAAIRAGKGIAAAGQFAQDVVTGGFHGACQLRQRRACQEVVANHDAGPARAPDATIQRCVSGLEVGDGTPALVLHVQQSETLGLVIGDSLQQGTQQRGFIVSINVEHPTRGP